MLDKADWYGGISELGKRTISSYFILQSLSKWSLYHQFPLEYVLISPKMTSESSKPYAFNLPDVPTPPPSYKHVAITPLLPTSRLITLAGMTGTDYRRADNPKTVREQAPIAYEKVKKGLAAAGATPRDIVQVKHYIVKDSGDAQVDKLDVVDRGWAEAWMEFMDREADGHRPPDTVIGVACLAKKAILYECEVWAVVHA
ncbi:uncharacterized protein PV09_00690 [Verruconis gallopava]|uniref:Uncharacterized protein n=1 Tax=Verruconis gallopava TaxID=253628 RepID=A0A0D1Z712_9PEZI|nr:uncharacterized protein PV09_00690 [Verruconis gallopava]KIW08752.1 hypothetical protein PV09_00690 [Verruconis gallopava]